LTVDELRRSLERQARLVRPGGSGTGTEQYQGLHVQLYTAETFAAELPPSLELVECDPYAEMDEGDSIRVVVGLRGAPIDG
jgi:hypothetical protein